MTFVFQFLQIQKKKQEEELSALRKEVVGLQIMKNNYDQIVKANQSVSGQTENQVPDEVKFHLVIWIFLFLFWFYFNHTFHISSSKQSWKICFRLLTQLFLLPILLNFLAAFLLGLKNIANHRYLESLDQPILKFKHFFFFWTDFEEFSHQCISAASWSCQLMWTKFNNLIT